MSEDPRLAWLAASEEVQERVLTRLHEEQTEEGHRSGFCAFCAANHKAVQWTVRELWDAGWRPGRAEPEEPPRGRLRMPIEDRTPPEEWIAEQATAPSPTAGSGSAEEQDRQRAIQRGAWG